MLFLLHALVLASLHDAVSAKPPTTSTITIGSSFPVIDLRTKLSFFHHVDTIPVAHPSLSQDATQATVDADLLLCNDLNCVDCEVIDLSTVPLNTCIFAFFFESIAVVQPNNTRLPFEIFLSPGTECLTGTVLPGNLNTCFNVGGNGIDDFELATSLP
ncbi:hypothetical protein PYCCODRAFT_1458725 [Trametes coccinea BRFM310]|uniref:Uncharacterized protein n=1 Tax=Trametes coccinea (strain BRFM310) TaxID=1353009 RepID=A0A1Y2IQJ6_TRAC3|nr:hypothetical protein PYCCODRAFT_1458725 [Trametes coccinea BRFM310]